MILALGAAVLFILAMRKPKSEKVEIWILGLMWVLYALNTYSGDFKSYESAYKQIFALFGHYEPAFSLLMLVSRCLGLSFYAFRGILATLFLLLLYLSLERYTSCRAMAAALFMVFPFTYYMSVLRAGLAAMCMLLGVQYLHCLNKQNTFKFLACIAVATLFHYSSVFFLYFLLCRKRNLKRAVILAASGIALVSIGIVNLELVYDLVSGITGRTKTLQWISKNANMHLNWKGILGQQIVLLGNIVMVFLCVRIDDWMHKGESEIRKLWNVREIGPCLRSFFHKKGEAADPGQKPFEIWFGEFALNANIVILAVLPTTFFSTVFLRLDWVLIPINICVCINTAARLRDYPHKSILNRRFSLIGLLMAAWVIVLAVYTSVPYIGTENSVFQIFFNNLLIF